MKSLLIAVCFTVLAIMLYVTITASLDQDILTAARQLWPHPWFRATLADAYCGFIFFYLWVAWREKGVAMRIVWFVMIMALGNIAMAGYLLLQLFRLEPGDDIRSLLLKQEARRPDP